MKDSFPGVRIAKSEDDDNIFNLIRPLYDENALFSLSETKVRNVIVRCTSGKGGLVGVIDGPGGLEASIGLDFSQMFYSDDWYLNEIWMYVHKDHRRTTHAKMLVEFGKWTSDRLSEDSGVKIPFVFGVVTRYQLLPKMRLFQRQAHQIGAYFAHGIEAPDLFTQRKLSEVYPAFSGSRVPVTHGAER